LVAARCHWGQHRGKKRGGGSGGSGGGGSSSSSLLVAQQQWQWAAPWQRNTGRHGHSSRSHRRAATVRCRSGDKDTSGASNCRSTVNNQQSTKSSGGNGNQNEKDDSDDDDDGNEDNGGGGGGGSAVAARRQRGGSVGAARGWQPTWRRGQ
jgi:hypothetical protein